MSNLVDGVQTKPLRACRKNRPCAPTIKTGHDANSVYNAMRTARLLCDHHNGDAAVRSPLRGKRSMIAGRYYYQVFAAMYIR